MGQCSQGQAQKAQQRSGMLKKTCAGMLSPPACLSPAGGYGSSCPSNATHTLLSSAPGQTSQLSSPDSAMVLKLSKDGMLDISQAATGTSLWFVGPFKNCKAPYELLLLPNGLLALQDKAGRIVWTSMGACRGAGGCYSYGLQNDGQLVVRDGEGNVTWSSGTDAGTLLGPATGIQYQLTSGGAVAGPRVEVSCVVSGPAPEVTTLVSEDLSHGVGVLQSNAALTLRRASDGAVTWSPSNAASGLSPATLCIRNTSVLELTDSTGALLWSTSALLYEDSTGPFTAEVTSDGCLELLDGQCRVYWSNHGDKATKSVHATGTGAPINFTRPSRAAGSGAGSRAKKPVSKAGKSPAPGKKGPATQPGAGKGPVPKKSPAPLQASKSPAPQQASKPSPSPSKEAPAPQQGSTGSTSSSQQKRPPPPRSKPKASPSTQKSQQACKLHDGDVCGGVNLCGRDSPCSNSGCCSAGLKCQRRSKYTWRCK